MAEQGNFANRGLIMILMLIMIIHPASCRHKEDVKAYSEIVCAKIGMYEASPTKWCCNCLEGHFKSKDCRHGEPKTTICERCVFDSRDQTYMDAVNSETQCFDAITEHECLQNTRFIPGSYKQASRCECKDGYYSTSEILLYGCNKHSSCDPGYYPAEIGTNTSDTRCTNCPYGTFSNESSPTGLCQSFTKCQPNETQIAGTSTRDVICIESNATTTVNSETAPVTTKMVPVTTEHDSVQTWHLVVTFVLIAAAVFIASFRLHQHRKGSFPRASTQEEIGLAADQKSKPSDNIGSDGCFMLEMGTTCNSAAASEKEHGTNLKETGNADKRDSRNDEIEAHSEETPMLSSNEQDTDESPTGSLRSATQEIYQLIVEAMNVESLNIKMLKIKIEDFLQDFNLVSEMLSSLRERCKTNTLRGYIRNFLSDTEIDDIETDHRGDAQEIRYQWIDKCIKSHGRRLTPLDLLTVNDSTLPKRLRDTLLDVVIKKLIIFINTMNNKPD